MGVSMEDITKDRRVRWVLVIIGIILIPIVVYLRSINPKLGKPVETKVETRGNTTVTTRYWNTEEERKLAEKSYDLGTWGLIAFAAAGFSLFYGIKGLITIKKEPTE